MKLESFDVSFPFRRFCLPVETRLDAWEQPSQGFFGMLLFNLHISCHGTQCAVSSAFMRKVCVRYILPSSRFCFDLWSMIVVKPDYTGRCQANGFKQVDLAYYT